ncbi:MAG: rRNA maturation RNase YbeY [Bacteroidaceae bacterium]|nr:rRNA maturation RNase YbeY [Bacteroidaceae bacterium]
MITFNSLTIALPAIDQAAVAAWIGRVARAHDRVVGDINYVFCSDEELLDINRQYLQHDYYTDIITFDYSRGKVIAGDLYLSPQTIADNAQMLGKPVDEELHRVIVHGVLHLVGINDKGPGEREVMEAAEDAALAMR